MTMPEERVPDAGTAAEDGPEAGQPGSQQPVDAQELDPAHARAEEAAETPPHEDAESMEQALRERGPLGPADPYARQRLQQPTEAGPGTSLT